MALQTHAYKTDADVVKTEGPNRYSRDEATIPANAAAMVVGTILGRITTSGNLVPLAPSASDGSQTAAAIILETTAVSTEAQRVVVLSRHAEVVAQALIFPVGITTNQKNAALAQLTALGIVPRNGV